MTTPTIRYKDMTPEQRKAYHRARSRAYYMRNLTAISIARNHRYHNDPAYREAQRIRGIARRAKDKQAAAAK